jgi:hypothetical protein
MSLAQTTIRDVTARGGILGGTRRGHRARERALGGSAREVEEDEVGFVVIGIDGC